MSKATCEGSRRISIKLLKERGFLSVSYQCREIGWSRNGEPNGSISVTVDTHNMYVQFQYTLSSWNSDEETFDYRVRLVTTACYFGGVRYWFICPVTNNAKSCDRRVGVLYLLGRYFACRTCCQLAYQSQQITHTKTWSTLWRYLDDIDNFQEKIDGLRVKYWKGQPTKRYRRLLTKAGHQNDENELLLLRGKLDQFLLK